MPFACSICEETATQICVRCTKDTCGNHLCQKCGCCSDCCGCDVPLDELVHAEAAHPEVVQGEAADVEAGQDEAADGEAGRDEALHAEVVQDVTAQAEAVQDEAVQDEAAELMSEVPSAEPEQAPGEPQP